jgi:hypothetical protein
MRVVRFLSTWPGDHACPTISRAAQQFPRQGRSLGKSPRQERKRACCVFPVFRNSLCRLWPRHTVRFFAFLVGVCSGSASVYPAERLSSNPPHRHHGSVGQGELGVDPFRGITKLAFVMSLPTNPVEVSPDVVTYTPCEVSVAASLSSCCPSPPPPAWHLPSCLLAPFGQPFTPSAACTCSSSRGTHCAGATSEDAGSLGNGSCSPRTSAERAGLPTPRVFSHTQVGVALRP